MGLYINQRRLIFFPSILGPETPKDHNVDYEEVYFTTSDEITLHGWWVPQPEDSSAPRLSLLYCHGNAATLSMLSYVAAIFYSYKVDAFLFDYRSYGASKGEKRHLTENNLNLDARAALEWLKKKRPNQRVIVWGHSLGAAVAARIAFEHPVEGLILEGAFSSVPEMARHRYPFMPIIERFFHSSFKTLYYVQNKNRSPLLMIHAERDSVIPISLGKKTYGAASEPKEWMLIKDSDHNDFPNVHEEYREKIEAWLQSVLNGSYSL